MTTKLFVKTSVTSTFVRTHLIFFGFLLILPPLALLYYIESFGVNVIYWDEWTMISIMQKEMSGTLTFFDLFVQHNEHRLFFPRIVMLTIGKFTQYNTKSEMFFSWILICLTALLIFHLYWKKSYKSNYLKVLLGFLPVSLLLFSFIQYESILWGFTCQIYMMIFGTVATFYLLDISKKVDIWFVLSFLVAILASYSFVLGLLVWPVGSLQLLISQGKGGVRKVTSWSFVGAFVFGSYFYGYVSPSRHPSLFYFLTNPSEALEYFFSLLGSPLSYGSTGTTAFGLFMTSIAVFLITCEYREKLFRRDEVWIALILFVALSSIAITVGRVGLPSSPPSRYTPITILGIISLYLLGMTMFERRPSKSKNFAVYAMLTLILVGTITSYDIGLKKGQQWMQTRELSSYFLTTYRMQSDGHIRKYLYPYIEEMRDHIEFCERYNLNVFSKPILNTSALTLLSSATLYSIDSINDKKLSQHTPVTIDLKEEKTITIQGWAIDELAGKVASSVFITIDNDLDIPAYYGLERSDVSQRFNNSDLKYSGYRAIFSSSILDKGIHSISLKVVSNSGEVYYYYPHDAVIISVV